MMMMAGRRRAGGAPLGERRTQGTKRGDPIRVDGPVGGLLVPRTIGGEDGRAETHVDGDGAAERKLDRATDGRGSRCGRSRAARGSVRGVCCTSARSVISSARSGRRARRARKAGIAGSRLRGVGNVHAHLKVSDLPAAPGEERSSRCGRETSS